ncbi:MAG: response regulator [Campylobacterota bacterium]|nr:response regulator [Campylobacterota bacterium]
MYDFNEVHQYSKHLNILYVEDNKRSRDEYSNIFNIMFESVDLAVDGEDGLNKYIEYEKKTGIFYDLVITDINMPKKNGMEMIKDIISIHKNQAIVVISAYDDSDKLIEMINRGVASFILKPIKTQQLILIFFQVCKNIFNQKLQDDFLLQRSKMAAMGELVDAMSKNWRKPLNSISLKVNSLSLSTEMGENITKEILNDCNEDVQNQIKQFNNTLDAFFDKVNLLKLKNNKVK